MVSEKTASGEEVTLSKEGYSEGKKYYYYVEVTDGMKTTKSEIEEMYINAKPVITTNISKGITVSSSNPRSSTSYI